MNKYINIGCAALLAVILAGAVAPAEAQPAYTFSIRDGKVYVDGQPLQADQLPETLDVTGLQASYTFSGDARPVLALGGQFYMLDGQRLREVEDWQSNPQGVTLFVRDQQEDGTPMLRQYHQADPHLTFLSLDNNAAHLGFIQNYMQRLNEQATELQLLSQQQDGRQRTPELFALAEKLGTEVQQAARVAEQLPQIEMESYLGDVQQRDHRLYLQLRQEQQMERETHRLAAQIRTLGPGDERDRLIQELASQLDAIFELKQQNRRQEIEQLEGRLEELNLRLKDREAMRAPIIERRLKQLIGESNNRDW